MPTERPHDVPLGMPSPEALQMATDAIAAATYCLRRCSIPRLGPSACGSLI